MIQLRAYTDSDYIALNSYQLKAEQARFTADIDYCVNRRKDLDDPDKTLLVIVDDGKAVGFFVLDCGEVIHELTDNPKAVAIRSLSINPDYQGKGLGTQAMRLVPDFLREYLPTIDEIVLSVNAKNTVAYHVYRQSGYVDTGRMIDGPMGAQHVLSLNYTDKVITIKAIETKRLCLRNWKASDLPVFVELNADENVMQYFPETLSATESHILAERIQRQIAENGWGFWAVELKNTQEFIGVVGLNSLTDSEIPHTPLVEIGWRLAKQHWEKGYATEAARAVLDFAFDELALEKVYAITALLNEPSQRLMKKLGMTDTQQNFNHPKVPTGHPLERHCLYQITSRRNG